MFDPRIGNWGSLELVKRSPRLFPKLKQEGQFTTADYEAEKRFYDEAAKALTAIPSCTVSGRNIQEIAHPERIIGRCEFLVGIDFASFERNMMDNLLKKNINFLQHWLEVNKYLHQDVTLVHHEHVAFEVHDEATKQFSFTDHIRDLKKKIDDEILQGQVLGGRLEGSQWINPTPNPGDALLIRGWHYNVMKQGWESPDQSEFKSDREVHGTLLRAPEIDRGSMISIGFFEGTFADKVEMMYRPLTEFVHRHGTTYHLHMAIHSRRFYYCSKPNGHKVGDVGQRCGNTDNMAWASEKPNMHMAFFGGHMDGKYRRVTLKPNYKLPESLSMEVKGKDAQTYKLVQSNCDEFYLIKGESA